MPLSNNPDEFFEKKLSVYNRSASAGDVMELPSTYVDSEHTGCDREMLEAFYAACRSEGGTADEIHLRGLHAVLARWGRPAPAAEGEVAELVAWLRMMASQAAEACQFTDAENLSRSADLLEQRQAAPVPVALSERPWEREGWCDSEGRCWIHCPGQSWDTWVLMVPQNAIDGAHCLPATALPLPAGEVES